MIYLKTTITRKDEPSIAENEIYILHNIFWNSASNIQKKTLGETFDCQNVIRKLLYQDLQPTMFPMLRPVHTMLVRNSAGIKWTRFETFHTMPSRCRFQVCLFSYFNFTLITVDNIYQSQNVSSNRIMKFLRFQTLTVSIPVSNFYG